MVAAPSVVALTPLPGKPITHPKVALTPFVNATAAPLDPMGTALLLFGGFCLFGFFGVFHRFLDLFRGFFVRFALQNIERLLNGCL